MNFAALKEFKKKVTTSVEDVADYLAIELAATIRELRAGLSRLRFEDNFESYLVEISVPINTELKIPNKLKFIPSKFLVVMRDEGGIYLAKGASTWTLDYLYIKNTSLSLAANATLIFLK